MTTPCTPEIHQLYLVFGALGALPLGLLVGYFVGYSHAFRKAIDIVDPEGVDTGTGPGYTTSRYGTEYRMEPTGNGVAAGAQGPLERDPEAHRGDVELVDPSATRGRG